MLYNIHDIQMLYGDFCEVVFGTTWAFSAPFWSLFLARVV